MKKNYLGFTNFVRKSFVILTAVAVIAGGFFVPSSAMAAHTATVIVAPILVKGGVAGTIYTFTINKTSGNDIVYVKVENNNFTNYSSVNCPVGWPFDNGGGTYARCTWPFEGDKISTSGIVSFTATAPLPVADTDYTWTVTTKDDAGVTVINTTDAVTRVDVTAPTVSAELASSSLKAGQTTTVTFTFSEVPTGFTADDVTVEHGSIGAVAGTVDPLVFTATLTPTAGVEDTTNVVTVGTGWTDPAGNAPVGTTNSLNYTIDTIIPTITATAPATSAFIKAEKVSYTLSEAAVATSGVITFTHTGGTADANPTHTCTLQGTALASGAHTDLVLAINANACVENWAVTPLVSGAIYTVAFNASDVAGNPATVVTNTGVTFDNVAPILNITAPLSGNKVNASAVIAFANDSDITPPIAECSVDNTNWTACTTGVTALSAIPQFAGLEQDAFTLYVKDVDLAGNTGTDSEAGIIKDTNAPTFSGITASPSPAKSGTEITVSFTASEVLLADPVVTIGGGSATQFSKTDLTYVYKRTLNGSETSGTAVVSISGTDLAGNSGTDTSGSLTIDFVAPTTTDNAPTGWQAGDVTITLTPFDPVPSSGIAWTRYCTGTVNTCDPAGGTAYSAPVTISTLGTSYFRYASQDNAGNTQATVSKTIMIDETNPAASVTGVPAGWVNSDRTATVDCSDTGGSACDSSNYKLQVSTVAMDSCSANPADYTISTSATISQHSWVCSYVKDNAGNPDFSNSPTEFKVDKINPTGSLTGVPPVWQNSDASITLNYGDTGGSEVASKFLDIVNVGGDCTYAVAYTVPVTVSAHKTACWKVIDGADNFITGSSEIKVDKTNPNTVINSPDANSWHNTDFSLGITDTDSGGSGLASCQYQVQSKIGGDLQVTKDWTVRACNAASPLITVGTAGDCRTEGRDTGTGRCYVSMKSTDNVGNTNTNSRHFSIDWTAPTSSATASPETPNGTDGWYKSTAPTITLSATDGTSGSDVSKKYYKWDDASFSEYSSALTVTAGTHTLNYYSTDNAGNSEIAQTQTYKVDITNPTVDAGADKLAKEQFTQTATATDGGSEINTATYQWAKVSGPDGGVITFGDQHALSTTISASLSGTYVISFTATDNAGNSSTDTFTLIWDTAPPTVVLTKDHADLIVRDADVVVITATFNEAVSAPTISIDLTGGDADISSTAMTATDDPKVWTYSSWNVPAGHDGSAVASVAGSDLAGNAYIHNGADDLTFTIDNIAPTFASVALGADEYVNAAETATGVNIAITTTGVENGQIVSCTITGTSGSVGPVTGAITGNAVTIASGALTGLANEIITATCSVSDAAGNPAANGTDTATKDAGIPAAPTSLAVTGGVINNANLSAVHITGNAETGSTVTVTVVGGATITNNSGAATGGGTFDIAINATTLNEGSINITARTVDAAGNVSAASSTLTVTKDTGIPTFASVALGADEYVNAAETATGVNIAITTTGVENGQIVSCTITGTSGSVGPVTGAITGNAVTIASGALTGLADGTITATCSVSDTAGNPAANGTDTAIKDVVAPTLTLNSMFNSQTLIGGNNYPISWSAFDLHLSDTSSMKVEYSISGGADGTWVTIAENSPNDSSEDWYVPSRNTSNGKVKVTVTDLAGNSSNEQSSGIFNITYSIVSDTTAPVATLNSPNGGESWGAGSTHSITWTATDNLTAAGSIHIKLEYSANGGAGWNTIIADTSNSGVYPWLIPADLSSTNTFIRVTATDAASITGLDTSNALFNITTAVTYPSSICTGPVAGVYTCTPIALSAGWNLISLPVIPVSSTIANVLSGISGQLGRATYYDATDGNWYDYVPGVGGSLTAMQDGNGYWLFMNSPATLTVTGTKTPTDPTAHAPTYSILSGWNLVGYKSVTAYKNTSTYLSTLPSGYILFDQNSADKSDSYMQHGKGYWLWSTGIGSIIAAD